jgi:tRNA (adenine37-N6)-methyltransferase
MDASEASRPPATLNVIGRVHAPYPTKFGVPRQPGLTALESRIVLEPRRGAHEGLRGIESFSHLWVIFGFHRLAETPPGLVRPPRLGGNAKVGVYATRSGFRPNRLGLSVVRQLGVEGLVIRVQGGDFVDGTPVFDLKPYLPAVDAVPHATADWADEPSRTLAVQFEPCARAQLQAHPEALRLVIEQTLRLDPRPAYRARGPDDRTYGVRLLDADVRFLVEGETAKVVDISRADER